MKSEVGDRKAEIFQRLRISLMIRLTIKEEKRLQ